MDCSRGTVTRPFSHINREEFKTIDGTSETTPACWQGGETLYLYP